MKIINQNLLLLIFAALFGNICNAKSLNKDSIELNLCDSVAVDIFINTRDLCEQIDFVLGNIDCFIGEDESYAKLIIISISKKSHRSITIPTYNHRGGKVSAENKSDYLSKQLRIIFSEHCK
jgi:hypothetical protein